MASPVQADWIDWPVIPLCYYSTRSPAWMEIRATAWCSPIDNVDYRRLPVGRMFSLFTSAGTQTYGVLVGMGNEEVTLVYFS
jgi:hypothetical protein